jgi:hypothetical protein
MQSAKYIGKFHNMHTNPCTAAISTWDTVLGCWLVYTCSADGVVVVWLVVGEPPSSFTDKKFFQTHSRSNSMNVPVTNPTPNLFLSEHFISAPFSSDDPSDSETESDSSEILPPAPEVNLRRTLPPRTFMIRHKSGFLPTDYRTASNGI